MKKIIITLAAVAIILSVNAQNGQQVINKLCGCFEVDFKYAETFSPDPGYKYHEREELAQTIHRNVLQGTGVADRSIRQKNSDTAFADRFSHNGG